MYNSKHLLAFLIAKGLHDMVWILSWTERKGFVELYFANECATSLPGDGEMEYRIIALYLPNSGSQYLP